MIFTSITIVLMGLLAGWIANALTNDAPLGFIVSGVAMFALMLMYRALAYFDAKEQDERDARAGCAPYKLDRVDQDTAKILDDCEFDEDPNDAWDYPDNVARRRARRGK